MKKPRGPRTRAAHERRDRELATMHESCRKTAEAVREKERLLHENITAMLRAGQEDERPVWRRER
jgi:hypothetical protein